MPFTNKTAFIKSLPVDLTAEEIIEAAKKQGITLSKDFVHHVRGSKLPKDKAPIKERSELEVSSKHLRSVRAAPKRKARAQKSSSRSQEAYEAIVMEAILALGLTRVEALIERLKQAFG